MYVIKGSPWLYIIPIWERIAGVAEEGGKGWKPNCVHTF